MKLFRELGLASATFLVIGNIVGIGIFTTSGLIAQEIGRSGWVIGVWVIGGVLALIGAICYSLLGIHTPKAGGEYVFIYPCYGPLVAFLAGWASLLIGFSAPIAAAALGLVHYLRTLFPVAISERPWGMKLMAILILLAVSFVLSLGLKLGARVHSFVTLLNLGMIFGFSLLVLWRSTDQDNLAAILNNGQAGTSLPALGSAVILVMFAYSGWNAAAYIAEEIRTPRRNIPGALIAGTLTVTLAYVLINFAYFAAVPLAELQGKIPIAEIAAAKTLGEAGPALVNVLLCLSILSSLTAMSIAGPRVYFAMSRDQLFPQWLCSVDAQTKAPRKSIWFQSAVAVLLISAGTFYEILLYSGFILLLFATLTVSTVFQIRENTDQPLLFWCLYRFLPAVFVATNTVVLINAIVSHPKETLAGLATVGLGLPVYRWYKGKKKS